MSCLVARPAWSGLLQFNLPKSYYLTHRYVAINRIIKSNTSPSPVSDTTIIKPPTFTTIVKNKCSLPNSTESTSSTPSKPPTQGYYRKILPSTCISFSSNEGRSLFREALSTNGLEGYFTLAEQFDTQSEPEFCGPGTLAIILNALALDPNRIWKGPWRWFSEDMLQSCMPFVKDMKKQGITFSQFSDLARCNGAHIQSFHSSNCTEEQFRRIVMAATSRSDIHLVTSYCRSIIGQTGTGHFSPIGGYHREKDLVLLLDTARFKYPPHWIPLSLLFKATNMIDPVTNLSRGFCLLSAPKSLSLCRTTTPPNMWSSIAKYFCDLSNEFKNSKLSTEEKVRIIIDRRPWQLDSILLVFFHRILGNSATNLNIDISEIKSSKLYKLLPDDLTLNVPINIKRSIDNNSECNCSRFEKRDKRLTYEIDQKSLVCLFLLSCPKSLFSNPTPDVLSKTLQKDINFLSEQMGILSENCSCKNGESHRYFSPTY